MIEADAIATQYEKELFEHIPALTGARIRARPFDVSTQNAVVRDSGAPRSHTGHHHAPAPVAVEGLLATGTLQIVDTSGGERIEFTSVDALVGLEAEVVILRALVPDENLPLVVDPANPRRMASTVAPQEPHEFDAELRLKKDGREETLAFQMSEPH